MCVILALKSVFKCFNCWFLFTTPAFNITFEVQLSLLDIATYEIDLVTQEMESHLGFLAMQQ